MNCSTSLGLHQRANLLIQVGFGLARLQHIGQNNDPTAARALLVQEPQRQLQPNYVVIVGIVDQHAVIDAFLLFQPHRNRPQPIQPGLQFALPPRRAASAS